MITDTQHNVEEKVSYIVAIGASAGGLEAINEFFDNFSPNDNFSFVIIQHLSTEHKSLLVELLGKHTHMPVNEAKEGMLIKPKEIYVIPNNRFITLKHGKLKLIDKNISGPNNAVDVFFNSLAEDKKEKAVAIVLSGTGTDGTRGIEHVKRNGGLVIVQDPLSAKFDGMPNSAIASGQADLILEPELMPEEIFRLLQEKPSSKSYAESKLDDDKAIDLILKYIYQYTSYDFTHYKKPTISRRIVRRMVALEYDSITKYYKFLIESKKELQILCQDFLIGVTKFFRNAEAYSIIESKVLPQMITHKPDSEPIKVWVAACSTGQEAYSLAILIDECLAKLGKSNEVKIFASDIDKNAIEKAGRGSYSSTIVSEMTPERLAKYFIKKNDEYIVVPRIRKMIVFANHNVIKDPPYSRTDLVSCRNMLIYMDTALQKKVLSSLHFSLNTYGYLFLGSSETLSTSVNSFREVDRKWKIYQNVNPVKAGSDFYKLGSPATPKQSVKVKDSKGELIDLFKEMVSMEYNMAMFRIDNFYNIRETVGDYSELIKLPANSLSFNILKMVPEKLTSILGNTIRRAIKENKQVSEKDIRLLSKEGTRMVDIIVRPSDGSPDVMATIVLRMSEEVKSLDQEKLSSLKNDGDRSNSYVDALELELKEAQQNLQSAIEELETTNEELQSGNEELLSANEELQSSNEELQSLNEELHTVNSEHQLKIKELIELNEDLDNYFRSSFIGQIFLDEDLRIRKFNGAVKEMINVMDNDIGRPIQHLSNNFKLDHLLRDLDHVKYENEALEKEIELNDGKTFLMRIQNYILFDKTTSGYVISFVDVSDIRRLNNIIKIVFNSSPNGIIALNAIRGANQKIVGFEFATANKVSQDMFGITGEVVEHTRLLGLLSKEQAKYLFSHFNKAIEKEEPVHFEYCYEKEQKENWFDVIALKLNDGVVVTFSDVTDKKEVEKRLNENFDQLLDTEEKLRKLNADLESTIKSRTVELAESEERFTLVSKATNDAIWDWNLVDNSIWFNESFSNQFGYANGELNIGIEGWLSRIEESDRQTVHKSLLDAINKGKKQWSSEYKFIKADGKSSIIYDRGYILQDEYGTPIRVLSSMLDVTPLKEAQLEMAKSTETTRFIADAIPQLLWISDAEGRINFLNQKWLTYTGKSFDDLIKGFEEYIHPQDLVESTRRWNESLSTGSRFEREHRVLRKNGKYLWFLARAEAKRNENGEISLWIMTHTNIHEQKTNEELLEQKVLERTAEVKESIHQLEKSNLQLERSNYDLLQFASVASHDLKEPLRKILTFSSLLQKSSDYNETSNRYINSIVKTSERMRRLIDDLLMFSRLSDGNIQLEEIDINELIDEIKFDLEIVVKEKQATITYTGLPIIHGIPGQIRQLFQNLLSNSLKFSKKDVAPVIEISASLNELDGRKAVKIIFKDNGIGFQESYADKIFVIFQRLHPKQMYEGTGIGLAIVKKIVSLHGGEIKAFGVENEGAIFEINLPQ